VAAYHEIVFEGSLPVVRAFLMGLYLGKGWAVPFLCSDDHGIHGESGGHKVLEKIKLTKALTYVLVIDRHVPVIAEAAHAAQTTLGLAVRRDRAVREAEFDYTFAVFDRRGAAKLRALLAQSGPDLVRTVLEEREATDPKGKGVEIYTPEHEYSFKGAGTVRGELLLVLAYRNALRRFEQVTLEKVKLVLQ
jgi:hypothetical protein